MSPNGSGEGTPVVGTVSPSAIDLTTLQAVKDWAEVKGAGDDAIIQAAITGFSKYVQVRTGRDALASIQGFVDVYDGNGSQRMLLRNYPITELTSVMVDGATADIAASYGIAGVAIIEKAQGIGFVFGSSGRFGSGFGNIQVAYSAGYSEVPADLEIAAREAVATNYKRRAWADMKSKSVSIQGGTGTTTYQSWMLTPQIEAIIDSYTRRWSV